MGNTDKAIRLLGAALIIILYYTGVIQHNTLAIVLFVIAAILVLTSLVNFCPLYKLLGINTCKVNR